MRDAEQIQELIQRQEIRVVQAPNPTENRLDLGEAETISEVLREREAGQEVFFLSQDKKAIRIASALGITSQGIELSILEATLRQRVPENAFYELLERLTLEFTVPVDRIIEIEKFYREERGGGE